jgi:hypothetical protein
MVCLAFCGWPGGGKGRNRSLRGIYGAQRNHITKAYMAVASLAKMNSKLVFQVIDLLHRD